MYSTVGQPDHDGGNLSCSCYFLSNMIISLTSHVRNCN